LPFSANVWRVTDLSATQKRKLDESNFMRSTKSRSRGNKNRNNNRPTGGSIINRVFDSSGPDGKVRGTPQQIIEKYNQLHRDAVLSGDRVDAENFAQHAEHYTRLQAEAQREVDTKREEQEAQNRDRQIERDRERQDRLKAQEEAAANAPAPVSQDQPREQPHDQPDVIDAGLVETPEAAELVEQPKPQRKPRQRKPKPPTDAAPEAAE
jgi:hypothetical protein